MAQEARSTWRTTGGADRGAQILNIDALAEETSRDGANAPIGAIADPGGTVLAPPGLGDDSTA
ncbi:MAG: hypothetical protein M0Z46_17945 [Actinomycetota bacterium]|nr:hypothetical protein [Actinomycetota bacterium]MDA8356517.1 hypothetical protein [Actinomycetota bacterium]